MDTLARYNDALNQLPAPGCGLDCHPKFLSVANQGVQAGLDGERIFDDIRHSVPKGNRQIPDREITDAINKALGDYNNGTFTPHPPPASIVKDPAIALQRIIEQGPYRTAEELIKTSPVAIPEDPRLHTKLLIENVCQHSDFIFNGERYEPGVLGETIRSAVDWLVYFGEGGKTAPHIIVNPLTGLPAMKKDGTGETYRGDGNVKSYRYCLAEFDNLSREDQVRFWSAAKLPIVALIDSGGKSIHAWLDVSKLATVTTQEQWTSEIKNRLYDCILTPMGVDSACSNAARLSRLPGHFREEKGAWQRLLWLSPTGDTV